MKGGSMTAILLDIIFITALSRAFSVSIDKLTSPAQQEDGLENIPSQEPNVTNGETVAAILSSGGVSPDKTIHSLSKSQLEVAMLVNAFAATYNAAYRSVLDLCTHPNLSSRFYSDCHTDLSKALPHCSRWQLIP